MILDKLKETLAQVESDRRIHQAEIIALDETEAQLRAMIAKHSGLTMGSMKLNTRIEKSVNLDQLLFTGAPQTKDGLSDVVDILRAAGAPLHITQIAERLSGVRGTKVDRTAIEPGMNRHIQKTKKRRIDKFGPSTFGLPEWKQSNGLSEVA